MGEREAPLAERIWCRANLSDRRTPDGRSGRYDVREGFADLTVPIAADQPGAKRIQLDAGLRYTQTSLASVDPVTTFNIGGVWQPDSLLTARAQYAQGVRLPTDMMGWTAPAPGI
ncbi:TonB-dependent receptor domain-containing protein [Asticcacaulis sp. W401b]|uniref:TonB-dependent receptor domain-containing protein n=1 Tax=Asticcacaulis sp. W401b TaxID=3388666 RepID=UPI003970CA6E